MRRQTETDGRFERHSGTGAFNVECVQGPSMEGVKGSNTHF